MTAYTESMSEKELQESLVAELQYQGWKIAHFRAARKHARTWTTQAPQKPPPTTGWEG